MTSQPERGTARAGDAKRRPEAVADELLGELRARANPANVDGMRRYAISSAGTLGVTMPEVRALAREAKRELRRDDEGRHDVAAALWASGIHEARIMAALVDVPALVGEAQMEAWAAELDSWDVCDQLCINLFRLAPPAWEKASEWTKRKPEYVKRAGFVLGATLAVHEKSADDARFIPLLAAAERECTDGRNMVKKAVNWQVRQIGKRSAELNAEAIACCERILESHADSTPARWMARDALRELRSDGVRDRLGIASQQ